MSQVNPTKLTWRGPSTNTDGTPIQYDVNYELGVVGDDGITPKLVVVANLRESEDYEAQISEMGFDKGSHEVVLRAIPADDPTRASEWSEPVSFIISDEIPNPPLELAVS